GIPARPRQPEHLLAASMRHSPSAHAKYAFDVLEQPIGWNVVTRCPAFEVVERAATPGIEITGLFYDSGLASGQIVARAVGLRDVTLLQRLDHLAGVCELGDGGQS